MVVWQGDSHKWDSKKQNEYKKKDKKHTYQSRTKPWYLSKSIVPVDDELFWPDVKERELGNNATMEAVMVAEKKGGCVENRHLPAH